MLALDRAIVTGDSGTAGRLDARLHELLDWIDLLPAPVGIREATALRGVKVGPHATPLGPEGQRKLAEFREWFQGWLPAVKQECEHA
jgi:dihydrodipicolinate synthase/N-acetylneuraminate lyase